ncbi:MAG: glycoside hydrolase family 32 protein [Cyclobacteriaceae bacterium]|nr:glycoside hydrolase family 32 protein [Cyclobacteriaceae bacterium]
MKNTFIATLFIITLISCNSQEEKIALDRYRPRFHYTPEKNWVNDPNGLVFHEGEYHLFYQYNPVGTTWGHMSWGHAVSKDLINWQQLPVAIEEYLDPITGDSTMIFSGTAFVDKNNTSGLCAGKDCMIAIYTSHVHKDNQGLKQHQSLAYSNDNGRTWKRYGKNPILDIDRKDFRDPKVFWYEPQQKWVMALVIPDLFKVQLYESKNLLNWSLLSEFGDVGDTLRIWECPDLYELSINGNPNHSKWVLSLSGSHPAGPDFVGMQYFVGDFDGTHFKSDQKNPLYLEFGKDFYAGIVFNNLPNRTVMMGWVNNWTYANQLPTNGWRGAFSFPRELTLAETEAGLRLSQKPIDELITLRGEKIEDLKNLVSQSFELEVELHEGGNISLFGSEDEATIIGFENGKLFLDRSKSGNVAFNKDFASIESVNVLPRKENIGIRLLVDQSIIEIFSIDGLYTITDQVFPTRQKTKVSLNGKATLINGWLLKSQ